MTNDRLGYWSAVALVCIGVGYVLALLAGFARHGFREPIGDPVLAVMEVLTLLSAVPIVTLMASIQDRAAPHRSGLGLAALAFATLCAGVTSTVHFVELTAARQVGEEGIVWPSRVYAAELLAWDVFLGLSLSFAAPLFRDGRLERAVRGTLFLCGGLCLAGAVGPAVGNMRLQLIGVLGYAVILPIACVLLARLFRRRASLASDRYRD
ncbi:MAG: hypothetical protein IPM29_01510 [Planctomycetes bacterium]|nr:hypothetical protein [Planctomycetota bacterium]